MTKNKIISLLCPIAFLLFGIYVRISTLSMSRRDAAFPSMVAYVVIAISIIQLIVDLRKTDHKPRFSNVNFLKLGECVAVMMVYIFLLKKIGFVFDTLLLSAFTMYILGYKKYKILIFSSVLITAIVFGAFYYLLNVPLPTLWL